MVQTIKSTSSFNGEQMNVDTTQTNHLSFCAGYGGIDLGLRRVLPTCRTIAYVEIEAFAVANLAAKMEAGELDQAPIWTNLKTFNAEPFRGLVDIISGGYPCQPFSAAGKRLGKEDPRHLWPFLRRSVRVIRPRRVFFENVEGHISLGLSTVISDLEEDGYRTTWGIFSAAECGASHQRKRVFIYGELADSSSTGLEGQSRSMDVQRNQPRWNGQKPNGSTSESSLPPAVANPNSERGERSRHRLGETCEVRQRRQDSEENSQHGGQQLAYPNYSGGTEDQQQSQLRSEMSEQSSCNSWPSRPGEAQKRWEEPRTVADPKTKELGNTKSIKSDVCNNNGEPSESQCGESGGAAPVISGTEAEPRLGGATDGCASGVDTTPHPLVNRVDRLRLLGNGVVPAVATKAWLELSSRFK